MHRSSYPLLVLVAALLLAVPLSPLSSSKSNNPCVCHGEYMYLDILEGNAGNTLPAVLDDGQTLTVAVVLEVTTSADENDKMTSITATLASQNGFFSVAVPTYNVGTLGDKQTATATWKISVVAAGNDVLLITAKGVNKHNNLQFSDSYSPSPSVTVNKVAIDLPPVISLTAPAAGLTISGGTDVPVTWQVTDEEQATCLVNLYYSTDDFASVNQTIATGLPAPQGYSWKTPLIDSVSVRVKATVTDKKGNFNTTVQGGVFSIDSNSPSVLSVQPADKEAKVSGSAAIQVKFSEPVVGSTAQTAFGISPPPGGVSWSWSADNTTMTASHDPFDDGTTYTCTVSSGVKDLSSPGNVYTGTYSWTFSTPETSLPVPSISLFSPAGGARFYWGDQATVRWTASGGTGTLSINLSISENGAAGPLTPIVSAIANSGQHAFTIPQLTSDDCLVEATVSDQNGKEARSASGPFSIAQPLSLSADLPAPGTSFRGGDATSINWTSAGGHGTVLARLSFQKDSGSPVQTLHSNMPRSGSQTWTAPDAETVSARLFVTATDDWGRSFEVASGPFTILAAITIKGPPRFASDPVLRGEAGVQYTYTAQGVGGDGDIFAYYIVTGQPGMGIDRVGGKVTWTPAKEGNYSVALMLSDGKGGWALQEFNIDVAAGKAHVRPVVTFITPSEGQKINARFTATGTVVKGTQNVTKVQFRVDYGDWMDASGTAVWQSSLDMTTLTNGNHTLQARAFDGTGYSDTAYRTVVVDNPKPSNKQVLPMIDGWMVVALLATIGALYYVRRK